VFDVENAYYYYYVHQVEVNENMKEYEKMKRNNNYYWKNR